MNMCISSPGDANRFRLRSPSPLRFALEPTKGKLIELITKGNIFSAAGVRQDNLQITSRLAL